MNSAALSATSNPRVWVYARYSTDKQTAKSIQDLVAECRQFCDRMSWRIAEVLVDEEVTGFVDRRPGYQKLLDGIETGAVDIIVGENIDRIVRDGEHSARLSKLSEFYGVKIWTIQEGIVDPTKLAFKTMMNWPPFRADTWA